MRLPHQHAGVEHRRARERGGDDQDSGSGDQIDGRAHLRGAGARAHPTVAGGGCEVAGVGHGVDLSGGRSSGSTMRCYGVRDNKVSSAMASWEHAEHNYVLGLVIRGC